MASWASMVTKPAAAAEEVPEVPLANKQVAVVDANAIITMGAAVSTLGEVLVTTEEVLAEIRDSKSREVVESVPFVCRIAADEAIRAVSEFARKTGDMHQLSAEDLRLLAVVYTLESELNGVQHLRSEPAPVHTRAKQHATGQLPGWGNNGASDEWDAIDAVEDATSSADEANPTNQPSLGKVPEAEALVRSESGDAASAFGGGSGNDDDDDQWEIARKSSNAARRAKRKEARRASRIAANGAQANSAVPSTRGDEASDASSDDDEASEQHIAAEHGDGDDSVARAEADSVCESFVSKQSSQSNVFLVTADFAMQNVALQMGLRLETKDGRRVTSLKRFVLRCEGCRTVCKAAGKLFCPECGHPTLTRVQVIVGPDGAEHYGVRKKHVLKGTRYTLPKPRGGRNAANPILSEDVFDAKVRKPRNKKVSAEPAESLDELTFGELKKHANQPAHVARGLAHLSTGWRNNPNERKNMPRSNRRR